MLRPSIVEFHQATSLDRKQQSHKGYKGRDGEEDVAHFDVIFNLRKPLVKNGPLPASRQGNRPQALTVLRDMIASIACDDSISARGLQGIHAEVMRRLASRGDSIFVNFADVRKAWEKLTRGESAAHP